MMMPRAAVAVGRRRYPQALGSSWNDFRISTETQYSFYSNERQHQKNKTRKKKVLVVGSSGALGSNLSRHLSLKCRMNVLGADIIHAKDQKDRDAIHFVKLPPPPDQDTSYLTQLTSQLLRGVEQSMNDDDDDGLLDAIICTSGGFEKDEWYRGESLQEAAMLYAGTVERMLQQNVYPVVAAGCVAHHFMANEGLFINMGASAALAPTPGTLGFGLAKAATHHFTQSFGAISERALNTKAQRKHVRQLRTEYGGDHLRDLTVVGILPKTLDTPHNRKTLLKDDTDVLEWTDMMDIAKEMEQWIIHPDKRPHSGSLVKVIPNRVEMKGSVFQLIR